MSRDTPFAEFAVGTAILDEGGPARAMYIIESGRVEVRQGGAVLGELGPGDVFGEMALLQEQPHSASVVAKTAVRALEIDQASFYAVLRENSEVAVQLMRQLVLRLRGSEQRRMALEQQLAGAGTGTGEAASPRPGRPAADAGPAPRAARAPAPTDAGGPPAPSPAAASAPPKSAPPAAPTPVPVAGAPPVPAAAPAAAPPAAKSATPPPGPAVAAPPPAAAVATGAPVPAPGAWCIRHAGGAIALAGSRGEWLVGRPDPATGQVPEVDLGALDVARSLSRRHARLREEAGRIMLREEPGVANGTWVNGERVPAGAAVALNPGDRLRFGAVEVEFAAQ